MPIIDTSGCFSIHDEVPQTRLPYLSGIYSCFEDFLLRTGPSLGTITRHKITPKDTSDLFFSRTIKNHDTIPRMLALTRSEDLHLLPKATGASGGDVSSTRT
jgi:hypothetical protein